MHAVGREGKLIDIRLLLPERSQICTLGVFWLFVNAHAALADGKVKIVLVQILACLFLDDTDYQFDCQ